MCCFFFKSTQPIDSCLKALKDERKRSYKESLKALNCQKTLAACIPNPLERTDPVLKYTNRAMELCWLMSIQDPPVVVSLKCEQNEKFDKNLFHEYTRSGNVYEFLVWPVLLLCEEGPLLRKGIAQPKQKTNHTKKSKKPKQARKSEIDNDLQIQSTSSKAQCKEEAGSFQSSAKSQVVPGVKDDLFSNAQTSETNGTSTFDVAIRTLQSSQSNVKSEHNKVLIEHL